MSSHLVPSLIQRWGNGCIWLPPQGKCHFACSQPAPSPVVPFSRGAAAECKSRCSPWSQSQGLQAGQGTTPAPDAGEPTACRQSVHPPSACKSSLTGVVPTGKGWILNRLIFLGGGGALFVLVQQLGLAQRRCCTIHPTFRKGSGSAPSNVGHCLQCQAWKLARLVLSSREHILGHGAWKPFLFGAREVCVAQAGKGAQRSLEGWEGDLERGRETALLEERSWEARGPFSVPLELPPLPRRVFMANGPHHEDGSAHKPKENRSSFYGVLLRAW